MGDPNGGDFRGYTDLFDYLIPGLLNNGFTDEEMEQFLIKTPGCICNRVESGWIVIGKYDILKISG